MTDQEIIKIYHQMCPLIFLHFQIEQYTKRLSEARNTNEQEFLNKELIGFKKCIIVYYN